MSVTSESGRYHVTSESGQYHVHRESGQNKRGRGSGLIEHHTFERVVSRCSKIGESQRTCMHYIYFLQVQIKLPIANLNASLQYPCIYSPEFIFLLGLDLYS